MWKKSNSAWATRLFQLKKAVDFVRKPNHLVFMVRADCLHDKTSAYMINADTCMMSADAYMMNAGPYMITAGPYMIPAGPYMMSAGPYMMRHSAYMN